MQQQRRVGRPIGPQQGYNNQGAGGYQQDQQQQNQGSKARFINPTIRANAIKGAVHKLSSQNLRFFTPSSPCRLF